MKTISQMMLVAVMGMGLAFAARAQVEADYRLKPGDRVAISLSQAGQVRLQYEVKLDSTGQFDLPLQSEVVRSCTILGGSKSARELTAEVQGLLNRYEPGVMAAVTVTSGGRSSGMVTFCGEASGVVFLDRQVNTHVAAAVHFIGPSRFANLRKVTVNRIKPDGATHTIEVNVEKILRAGGRGDLALQAGDIVNVPASHLPGHKPVTDHVPLSADPLKLFCQLSNPHQAKPAKPEAADLANEPEKAALGSAQLAAR